MTEPNQQELDKGTPVISLAGKQWPVPLLAIRQNRTVVPLLMRVMDKFQGAGTNIARGLDTQTFDDLISIVFAALNKAHPSLLKADFEDMSISVMDLINAVPTISQQTGLMVRVEAPTEKKMNSQSGIGSSPTLSPLQDGDGTNARMN